MYVVVRCYTDDPARTQALAAFTTMAEAYKFVTTLGSPEAHTWYDILEVPFE